MNRARWRALLFTLLFCLIAAALALASGRRSQPRANLLLLTSLPIVFGEDFSLQGAGSPALSKLRERYEVLPISVTNGDDLAKGRLLLMAQPQAQTAENLVVLDRWVRDGGRVMLLADPMLEWPS